ncbi:MAG: hypothetical protein CFE44_21865 [Burkholderiales bacterium PBB4]|nr:MAG: hypothetical protein CFE44_21865 [Burkholderiales bacterium PBB4]
MGQGMLKDQPNIPQVKDGVHVRLREARSRLGLAQDEFSKLVGVSRVTQMSYENGTTHPSTNYLSRAQAVGLNVAYLLFDLDDEASTNLAASCADPSKKVGPEDEASNSASFTEPVEIKKEGLNARLKDERVKMGYTQSALAAIGQRTRTAQVRYESGETCPDVEYLANLQSSGVDIRYVLNGRHKEELADGVNWTLLRSVFEAAQNLRSQSAPESSNAKLWELTRNIYEASRRMAS